MLRNMIVTPMIVKIYKRNPKVVDNGTFLLLILGLIMTLLYIEEGNKHCFRLKMEGSCLRISSLRAPWTCSISDILVLKLQHVTCMEDVVL